MDFPLVKDGKVVGVLSASPGFEPGDPPPTGYCDKHEWAAVQMKAGFRQVRCTRCTRFKFAQELAALEIATVTVYPTKRDAIAGTNPIEQVQERWICRECEEQSDGA